MEPYKLIVTCLPICISLAAFGFSIYTYSRVSFKNDFKKKQLDVIFELVEELQDTIIHVCALEKGYESKGWRSSMCRFFQLKNTEEYFEDFKNHSLFFKERPDNAYPFIKFCEHPFLPVEIATVLRKFVAYPQWINADELPYPIAVLGTSFITGDDKFRFIPNNAVYTTVESFTKQCIELDVAIHNWLKNVGITNFNKKEIID
ncbi:MAG: hypothetical protein JST76_14605 [Bacteroidetes bacterium]|nr:hypothetical protein [Bacteroidota bacterium]